MVVGAGQTQEHSRIHADSRRVTKGWAAAPIAAHSPAPSHRPSAAPISSSRRAGAVGDGENGGLVASPDRETGAEFEDALHGGGVAGVQEDLVGGVGDPA